MSITPQATGGGNTDGGCRFEYDFDPQQKSLTVTVQQSINHEHSARQTELLFAFDGEGFKLKQLK